MGNKLTAKQQAFIERYLVSFNGAEAARLAGYSAKSARFQAAAMLTNPNIKAAIAARIAELKATTDEVLLRLASHSRGNIDDFLGGFDRIDLTEARKRGLTHLIKKIKQRTTTISKPGGEDIETHDVELELYDAQAATVQLGKLLGMYVDRMEVKDWRPDALEHGFDPDLFVEVASVLQQMGGDANEAWRQFQSYIQERAKQKHD